MFLYEFLLAMSVFIKSSTKVSGESSVDHFHSMGGPGFNSQSTKMVCILDHFDF